MRTRIFTLLWIWVCLSGVVARGEGKYAKWRMASYFRGFNTYYWSDFYGRPLSVEDFYALKTTGANLAILQTSGFLRPESPYDSVDAWYVEALDSMVSFCRQVGLYYVISVRSGPGRQDVWEEGEGLVPPSTIWQNETEQQLYAAMLAGMAARYLPDSLFVGMDLIQEPNPYDDSVACMPPDQLDSLYSARGIDVNHIYAVCIESVRTVAPQLPLLVQAVHWSNPGYFSLVELQSDTLIVYNTHSYEPFDFTHADTPETQNYPDYYWGCAYDWYAYWNKDFFRDTVFAPVREFQNAYHVPIILGEFGLQWRQNGGRRFLRDVAECAVEFGWHFAFWQFRADSNFNYELMGDDYWATVCSLLTLPATLVQHEHHDTNEMFKVIPDPFNSVCRFELPSDSRIEIYDIAGNRVASVGRPYVWRPAADVPSGVYVVRVKSSNKIVEKTVVLIK